MRAGQPRPLTAAQQFLSLRGNPICVGTGALQAGRLVWRYRASPTPLSREYGIRIDYRQGGLPQATVYDPDLTTLSGGRRLPHVYAQKPARLCLYLPRADVVADLDPTGTRTACPYKGWASYWTVRTASGAVAEEAAWSYETPLHDVAAAAGYLCFDGSRVDVVVDARA